MTSLLFGCETWTLKKAHIARLEWFHQSCLRKIARIRWFHKVTNYEVLQKCKAKSIEYMVLSAVLRWTGHVTRMSNDHIPKRLLYGRLATGRGTKGNHATYANQVKRTLHACGIRPVDLEVLAAGRSNWSV